MCTSEKDTVIRTPQTISYRLVPPPCTMLYRMAALRTCDGIRRRHSVRDTSDAKAVGTTEKHRSVLQPTVNLVHGQLNHAVTTGGLHGTHQSQRLRHCAAGDCMHGPRLQSLYIHVVQILQDATSYIG